MVNWKVRRSVATPQRLPRGFTPSLPVLVRSCVCVQSIFGCPLFIAHLVALGLVVMTAGAVVDQPWYIPYGEQNGHIDKVEEKENLLRLTNIGSVLCQDIEHKAEIEISGSVD